MKTYETRSACRSCGQHALNDVLTLGSQYIHGFLKEKDENWPRAPLDLARCAVCGLLQLRHETNMDLLVREYWYRSSVNQSMRDALGDVVADARHYAKEGVWLDIGANDGYLLSRVSERFTKIAAEPALNMQPLLEEHADIAIADYFSADAYLDVADSADVITSCAMFYHLNDPNRFVQDIARCLTEDGVWINQFSDAPTMLKLNAFDAICHEHNCYYSVHDLKRIYDRHGLSIVSIKHNAVNGGSVRVAAMKNRTQHAGLHGVAEVTHRAVSEFAERVVRWKGLMRGILDMAKVRNQDVWGIGASTKAACLLQYLGESDRIVAIGDRNPAKHGLVAAGSWIPVVDEATMRKAEPAVALNLIWAFREEILAREEEMRRKGTTIINVLPNIELVT